MLYFLTLVADTAPLTPFLQNQWDASRTPLPLPLWGGRRWSPDFACQRPGFAYISLNPGFQTWPMHPCAARDMPGGYQREHVAGWDRCNDPRLQLSHNHVAQWLNDHMLQGSCPLSSISCTNVSRFRSKILLPHLVTHRHQHSLLDAAMSLTFILIS
jgi:hypothetical protein